LTFSLAGFVGLAVKEHYVGEAMIPVPGDRPTIGFGSTFHEDGRPVKLGERTTPVRALKIAAAHLSKDEVRFRESIKDVYLHSEEYDMYLAFTYQFGINAWLNGTPRRRLLAGDYRGACEALRAYRFVGKADCSLSKNWGPGTANCRGVGLRAQERYELCVSLL